MTLKIIYLSPKLANYDIRYCKKKFVVKSVVDSILITIFVSLGTKKKVLKCVLLMNILITLEDGKCQTD